MSFLLDKNPLTDTAAAANIFGKEGKNPVGRTWKNIFHCPLDVSTELAKHLFRSSHRQHAINL